MIVGYIYIYISLRVMIVPTIILVTDHCRQPWRAHDTLTPTMGCESALPLPVTRRIIIIHLF
jgi:hypothetical protein